MRPRAVLDAPARFGVVAHQLRRIDMPQLIHAPKRGETFKITQPILFTGLQHLSARIMAQQKADERILFSRAAGHFQIARWNLAQHDGLRFGAN